MLTDDPPVGKYDGGESMAELLARLATDSEHLDSNLRPVIAEECFIFHVGALTLLAVGPFINYNNYKLLTRSESISVAPLYRGWANSLSGYSGNFINFI